MLRKITYFAMIHLMLLSLGLATLQPVLPKYGDLPAMCDLEEEQEKGASEKNKSKNKGNNTLDEEELPIDFCGPAVGIYEYSHFTDHSRFLPHFHGDVLTPPPDRA